MEYFYTVVILYAAYYTLGYSRIVWKKEKNKLASIVIALIALLILVLPILKIVLKRFE